MACPSKTLVESGRFRIERQATFEAPRRFFESLDMVQDLAKLIECRNQIRLELQRVPKRLRRLIRSLEPMEDDPELVMRVA